MVLFTCFNIEKRGSGEEGQTVLAVLNWGIGLVKLMCCEFLVPGLVIEV